MKRREKINEKTIVIGGILEFILTIAITFLLSLVIYISWV